MDCKTARELAILAASSGLFANDESPFSAHVTTRGGERLVVITGENASGKSLFFKVMSAMAKSKAGISPITISIRERTGAGLSEMSSFRKTVMFGDEDEQSTGTTSVRTMLSGFKSARSWAEDGKIPLLFLDEPEIGLSPEYAKALGKLIAKETSLLPETSAGTVVVTHNRKLVEGLVDEYGLVPSLVHMGSPSTLDEWLVSTNEKSVEELLGLQAIERERRSMVDRFLSEKRKARTPSPK